MLVHKQLDKLQKRNLFTTDLEQPVVHKAKGGVAAVKLIFIKAF